MKRMRWLLIFVPVLIALLGISQGGWATFAGVVYVFGLHPVLDAILGNSPMQASEGTFLEDLFLVFCLPAQLALLGYAFLRLDSMAMQSSLSFWGTVLSVGSVGGAVGITASHELIHRKQGWMRAIGVALLSLVLYAHFRIEHVFGHHRNVSTPNDPASSRKGESVYAFWLRSLIGTVRSAWTLEKGRGWQNRIGHYVLIQALILGLVSYCFGPDALSFFVAQACVAVLLLETTNYIEHYGLQRKPLGEGRFEPVSEIHSWDSARIMTNWTLFNLGMHAHHHRSASVPYPQLEPSGAAAHELPAGYSAMLLLALVPPLWRKVMDPRVPNN